MYAEACACEGTQDVDLGPQLVAPGFPFLIEKSCAHQCEEHAADGRLGQTALLDNIGQSGPRWPGPADE